MKKLTFTLLILSLAGHAMAQTSTNARLSPAATTVPALDKSPMDMSYFPADYPVLKAQRKTSLPPVIRVIYGRPQKDNRLVFGELIEYNKVWRLGANEATEIEFFSDVTIGGKKVVKGRYTLYAIPTETVWTIIVNKDTDSWGAFVYDEKKDVVRTDVPVTKLEVPVEPFSMMFQKTDKGANLIVSWENASVSLPIDFK